MLIRAGRYSDVARNTREAVGGLLALFVLLVSKIDLKIKRLRW